MKHKQHYMKVLPGIALLFGLFFGQLKAQDFHYTMYNYSPLTLNPGYTGAFSGDLRFVNNFRMQWNTVTPNAFRTYTAGLDGPIFKSKMQSDDYFAAGLVFTNDNAGAGSLQTNLVNGSFAFNKAMNNMKNDYVTVGVMMGYGQRSVNLSSLTWDEQYTGAGYNPNLPTGEAASTLSKGYFDMSAGITWNNSSNDVLRYSFGAAVEHLTQPNFGFYDKERLYMREVAHGSLMIRCGESSGISLIPNAEVAVQGPTLLVDGGMMLKYHIQDRSHYTDYHHTNNVYFGLAYRLNDAASFITRVDWSSYSLALSYDENISKLDVASKGVGGFEIMLMYTGDYSRKKMNIKSNPLFY
jgi:type IX secretion system PorP/SprF family membrane protein